VNEVVRVSPFELAICSQQMQNLPSKVLEELPSEKSEDDGGDGVNDGNGNDEWADVGIQASRVAVRDGESVLNLSVEECRVDLGGGGG
jgi:hypothetical protein